MSNGNLKELAYIMRPESDNISDEEIDKKVDEMLAQSDKNTEAFCLSLRFQLGDFGSAINYDADVIREAKRMAVEEYRKYLDLKVKI